MRLGGVKSEGIDEKFLRKKETKNIYLFRGEAETCALASRVAQLICCPTLIIYHFTYKR